MVLTKEDLIAIGHLFDARLGSLEERLGRLEERFDRLEARMERVESEVASLQAGQMELRKELKQVADKVEETYALAVENWGELKETRLELGLKATI